MIFYLLDKDFKRISVIDDYESVIWTDRYLEPGDFELYIPISNSIPSSIAMGRYLWFSESEHLMIIETIKIETDIEDGNKLTVSGRSLESILDRRIMWDQLAFTATYDRVDPVGNENPKQKGWYEYIDDQYIKSSDTTVVSGHIYFTKVEMLLQTAVKKLLKYNIISPSVQGRIISNFIFDESEDSKITSLTIDAEYKRGDSLLNIVKDICSTKKIGYKILLNLNTGKFIFSLYAGKDRTNRQLVSYVEFSSKLENLLNTDYSDDTTPFKNVTLVVGPEEDVYEKVTPRGDENPVEEGWYKYHDGEYVKTEEDTIVIEGNTYYKKIENEKRSEEQIVGTAYGLNRREVYTDASSVNRRASIPDDDGTIDYVGLSEEEFTACLIQKGKETLSKNKREEKFESEVDYTGTFKYGRDYKLGDIVQIINEYGFTGKSRVTEYIFSENTSDGLKCYPKFEMIEDEEEG